MRSVRAGMLRVACLVLLLGALAACVGMEVSQKDREAMLHKRVERFIEVRQQRDLIGLQKLYINPADARLGNIVFVDTKIVSSQIGTNGKSAEVKLTNTFRAMGFTFKDLKQNLHWIWHKGNWFIVPGKNKNPFASRLQQNKENATEK